jgi:hypothetical protein
VRVTPICVGSSKYTNVVISIVFAGTEQTIVAGEAPLFTCITQTHRSGSDLDEFDNVDYDSVQQLCHMMSKLLCIEGKAKPSPLLV